MRRAALLNFSKNPIHPVSGSIDWRPVRRANVAAPGPIASLIEQSIAARPENPKLWLKLANFRLDSYDFAGAAAALEAALERDPELNGAHARLAHSYNALGRHRAAIEAFGAASGPHYERGAALIALGDAARGEAELRQVLELDANHGAACRMLCKLLRRAERWADLLDLCEGLHRRGAGHSMLLYNWGSALALCGQHDRARAVLFDQERVQAQTLPLPAGFADLAEFNGALAEEILSNPYRLTEFPVEEQANRGSSRVHALLSGKRPELVQALLDALQALAGNYLPARYGAFDPWLDARPEMARLDPWGLIQRGGAYEEWHLHPAGWLSGVYYIRVPSCVTAGGGGPGCIEFGPPKAVIQALPGYVPIRRYAPCEGSLLLAPSHYSHRTIPSGADEYRISFAFDVVPERSECLNEEGATAQDPT
jgi:tetratricopeptide (TPR) repeat protein